jgi:hypothetical protein
LRKNVFLFFAATMAQSGFGPYHGQWPMYTPSKHIIVTSTSEEMMRVLGLGVLTPQPKLYHAYGTAIFHDFFYAVII